MPFCAKCGVELSEDAVFCPKCGSPVSTVKATSGVVYRREPDPGAGRILAIIFGGFMLLVAFGLVMGGGAILWTQTAIVDDAGYMMTGTTRLNVASYALVQNVDINMGSGWITSPAVRDIVSFKISATSKTGKPIFIGIATQQYVQNYLNEVNIDKLVYYEWIPNSPRGIGVPTYQTIPGGAPSSLPSTKAFWVAQASGTGKQTITWTPTTGEYWVVVMNSDSSAGVDVDAQVGARVGVLGWVGGGMFVGGLIVALIGVAVLYFGFFRRQ